jgi:oxygen-independent coproporphyrinogen III oxidase
MNRSLYVHIPFCRNKCPYCSFPGAAGPVRHEKDYCAALARELRSYAGQTVTSVYVGGGTPSSLSPDGIEQLVTAIALCPRDVESEFTFEFNPEDVTPDAARRVRSIGVTRVSYGMQSFHEKYLAYLGRRHTPAQGIQAFEVLKAAGFDNINVDVIFGFPGQSADDMERDIDQAVSLGATHVSLYALTIEPRSLFHVRGEAVADDAQADLYRRGCARLNAAGIEQYEVSNFARPGFESRHNLNYWQGGEYIGLGMGAHSHIDGVRSWNADTLPRYLAMMREGGSARTGEERLPPRRKMMETVLFGLRMNAGVDIAAAQKRYGAVLTPEQQKEFAGLASSGFLTESNGRVRATDRGRLVLDEIAARLIEGE